MFSYFLKFSVCVMFVWGNVADKKQPSSTIISSGYWDANIMKCNDRQPRFQGLLCFQDGGWKRSRPWEPGWMTHHSCVYLCKKTTHLWIYIVMFTKEKQSLDLKNPIAYSGYFGTQSYRRGITEGNVLAAGANDQSKGCVWNLSPLRGPLLPCRLAEDSEYF